MTAPLEQANTAVTLLAGVFGIVASGVGGVALVARAVVKGLVVELKAVRESVVELRDDARSRDVRINQHGEDIAALKVAAKRRRRK